MSDEKSRSTQKQTIHWGKSEKSKGQILNVRSEIVSQRNRLLAAIDRIGMILSKPMFFSTLLFAHLIWIILNLPFYPWKPWDPYPFTFLATFASVEAPFISLLILMHQRRNTSIDELRAEIQLQVSLHIERQSSISLRLIRELQSGLKINTLQDRELLDRMEVFLDPQELLEVVRSQMAESEGSDPATAT